MHSRSPWWSGGRASTSLPVPGQPATLLSCQHCRWKKTHIFFCWCLERVWKRRQQEEGEAFSAGHSGADPSQSLPEGGGHGGRRHQYAQRHSGLQVPCRAGSSLGPGLPPGPTLLLWAQSFLLLSAGLPGVASTVTCSSTTSRTPRPFSSSLSSLTTPSPFSLWPRSCTSGTTGPTSYTTSSDCCTTRAFFCGSTRRTSMGWREVSPPPSPPAHMLPGSAYPVSDFKPTSYAFVPDKKAPCV